MVAQAVPMSAPVAQTEQLRGIGVQTATLNKKHATVPVVEEDHHRFVLVSAKEQ